MMNKDSLKLRLLFNSTIDGQDKNQFHKKCDDLGPTIVIIKSTNGRTFGGYADKSWNTYGKEIKGEGKSFLF